MWHNHKQRKFPGNGKLLITKQCRKMALQNGLATFSDRYDRVFMFIIYPVVVGLADHKFELRNMLIRQL